MHWIPFAMVRIAAVFIAGVVTCIYHPHLFSEKIATALLLVFLMIYFAARFVLINSPSIKIVSGVIGLTAIFAGGYLNALLKDESKRPEHLSNMREDIIAYQVSLTTPAEEKEKSLKRTATLVAVFTEKGWRQASGKINLYWPKDEPVTGLDFGDVLLIKGQPRELESAYNPYEFDFKKFLKYKNVYHQQFVRHGEWYLLKQSDDQGFLFYAHRARNWSVSAIKKYIPSPREKAIVTALVLGVTDGLDTDLLNAYAASGAMHVLAVSGLHVSIIYGILLFFFRPLGKSATAQWTIAILSLVLLWGYAFLTGLSPSVLRAVTMFSFVAIAKPVGRTTNIYNTLAASAFCLLLSDPYLIMSVGFQLSYLAVLGIVYMQRPIYRLWEPKSAAMNWVWELSCVSIAAQIATFPMGFYYFHQFPVYFLVANLFIIPGSFVVLVGGILLIIISPLETLSVWLGTALEWFVRILNEGIFIVERIPFSVISDVYISATQCYLLFIVVIIGILLINFRKFISLIMIGVCVAIFSVISWCHLYEEIYPPEWTVYRVRGHSAMEWSERGDIRFAADSSLLRDKKAIKFHLQANRLFNGGSKINQHDSLPVSVKGLQLYHRFGKVFLWINQREYEIPVRLTVDYLIVSNDAVNSISKIRNKIEFGELIIDASNSFRVAEHLEKEALGLHLSCFSVLKHGYYSVKFNRPISQSMSALSSF